MALHTYFDGSILYSMSARALTHIPIWKGQRNIDQLHVKNINESIGSNVKLLDSGYKIVTLNEIEDGNPTRKSYLIDGQHRFQILLKYFEEKTFENDIFDREVDDFNVTVTEKKVNSESDIIKLFNEINNVKPVQFEEDPNLIINKYIEELDKNFPKNFRNITKRPYVSIDKFREALKIRINSLKKISVDNFIKECKLINTKIIQDLKIRALNDKEKELKIINRMIQLDFALAWDDKFRWLDMIIH